MTCSCALPTSNYPTPTHGLQAALGEFTDAVAVELAALEAEAGQ